MGGRCIQINRIKAGNRFVLPFGMNQANTAVSSESTSWLNQNFFHEAAFIALAEDVGRSAASSQVSITAHLPLGPAAALIQPDTNSTRHLEHYLNLPKHLSSTVKNTGYSLEVCII